MRFKNELGLDAGGVSRDMFSAFWETVYLKHFDGETLLIPAMHPNTEITIFPTLGTILSHGFLVSGFLPVRIAFPVLAGVLLGLDVTISDAILLESFVDFVGAHESLILREALITRRFSPMLQSQLIDLLSRLDCTEIPTPANVKQIVVSIAKHQLLNKPLGMLFTFNSGVSQLHRDFWKKFSVEKFFELYKALNATPETVLKIIQEPISLNLAQERVFRYLTTFIGNAKQDLLRLFLRFVTGSSVLMATPISISFNNLSGLGRRPISHTCDCGLELPISCSTFPEFENEFIQVLSNEMSYIMDAV